MATPFNNPTAAQRGFSRTAPKRRKAGAVRTVFTRALTTAMAALALTVCAGTWLLIEQERSAKLQTQEAALRLKVATNGTKYTQRLMLWPYERCHNSACSLRAFKRCANISRCTMHDNSA